MHYFRREFIKVWWCSKVSDTQKTRMPKENGIYYSFITQKGNCTTPHKVMGGTPSFGQEAEARVKREPRPWLLLGFPWETQGELGEQLVRLGAVGYFLIAWFLALRQLIGAPGAMSQINLGPRIVF